jgi:hypothetical protein
MAVGTQLPLFFLWGGGGELAAELSTPKLMAILRPDDSVVVVDDV